MTAKKRTLLTAEDWNGLLSYRCTGCRFAALQARQIRQHLLRAHGADALEIDAEIARLSEGESPAPEPEAVTKSDTTEEADQDG